MRIKKIVACAIAGAGLVGLGLAAPANADPNGSPTFRALAGVGSDTTDNVMQALSDVITISGVKQIGSYFATGSANIQTQSPAACIIPRPNGSGAGRTALLASLAAADNCLQFSRSSSGPVAVTPANSLTWVEFATDAVSFAVRSDGNVPKTLSLSDLQAIYTCQDVGSGGIYPVLPQTGSGTRSFWLGLMGVTEAQITAAVGNTSAPLYCLTGAGNTNSRAYVQEHTGNTLKVDEVTPYSVAQYNTQANGTITDLRGKAVLGIIDGTVPEAINTGFSSSFQRKVYNIIPTNKVSTAPWSTVFVGGSSLVCANAATIQAQGFRVDSTCGNTSQ